MTRAAADAFLESTERFYDECAAGISHLDRIIVACPASLVDTARTALVPTLYAYWERYFRLTFTEFLRCVALASPLVDDVNAALSRAIIRFELNRQKWFEHVKCYNNLENMKAAEIAAMLVSTGTIATQALSLCSGPLSLVEPEKLISTDSNVRFEVIEKNCKLFGLDVNRLRQLALAAELDLYPTLKALVDTRNDIAHGTAIHPMSTSKWEELREFTIGLMECLQTFLAEALSEERYRSSS